MFQLNSTNGKFDIVFAGEDLATDDKAKMHSIRGTTAGRRKNAEWKSHLFDKGKKETGANIKNIKTNKTSQLRLAKDRKIREKKAKPPEMPSDIQPQELESVKTPEKKLDIDSKILQTQSPEPTEVNTNITDENKSNFSRKDTYLKQRTKPDSSCISKKELNDLFNEFIIPENKQTEKDVKTAAVSDESYLMLSARQEEIRRKQATPVEEYYPWGKPGGGAPLKDEDAGNIRAELRRSIQLQEEKKKEEERAAKAALNSSGHGENVNKKTTPRKSQFVRGQGKQQYELDDLEERRLKRLDHERAIAEQVEEKRREKRLAREAQLKEEQEADARFQRERDLLQKRMEEENTKQMEKEEAKKRKQDLLEESIRKASEEAMRAKEEARHARMKKTMDRGETKNIRLEQPIVKPEPRKLHQEDEAILRASANQNFDEQYLGSDEDVLLRFTESSPTDQNVTPKSHDEQVSPKVSKIPKPSRKEPPKTKTQTVEDGLENEPPKLKKKSKPRAKVENRNEEENFHKVEKKEIAPRERKLKKQAKDSRNEKVLTHLVDDYLVPYHRTKTELLHHDEIESESPKQRIRPSAYSPKEIIKLRESVENEYMPTPESPSQRQQQILKQLHALRKGLIEKQREYIGSSEYPVY